MHVAFALADSGERWASASGVLRTCVLLRSTCSQILVMTGGGLCCDSSQHCRREVFGTNMHMGWDATALRTTGGLGWMGRPRRAVRKIVCVLTASCFDVSMCSPRPCRVESTRGPNRRRRGKCRWRSRLGKWGMGDGARCSYSSVHGQTEYVRVLCSFDRQEARVEQLLSENHNGPSGAGHLTGITASTMLLSRCHPLVSHPRCPRAAARRRDLTPASNPEPRRPRRFEATRLTFVARWR